MNTYVSQIRRFGLFAAVVGALVLVPSAASRGGPPYADGTGDSGSAGDIGGVTVVGDKTSGQLVFRVNGSNLSTSPDMVTILVVDSDANPTTGNLNWNGADYLLGVDDAYFDFLHWDGTDWVDASSSTVRVCCIGGGSLVTFSVNRGELGNTQQFNFMVRSRDVVSHANDDAPDDGMYNYSLAAGGPDIQGVVLQTTPSSGPRAGKKFVVTPIGVKLPPTGALLTTAPPPESYECHASLKGRTVAGAGNSGCTLLIPKKKARGKKLTVVIKVTYEGATKSVPFAFVVS